MLTSFELIDTNQAGYDYNLITWLNYIITPI